MISNLGNKQIMAENISYYMKEHEVTRKEMCEILGVGYTTLSDWLHALTYPRIDKIEAMANYFGVPKSALVEKHEEKPLNFDYLYFPQNLIYLRRLHGMLQDALADMFGVSLSVVQDWERGTSTPPENIIGELAKVFRVTEEELMHQNLQRLDISSGKRRKPIITIRVLGRVAAGIPIEAIEDVTGIEEITYTDGEYFGLRVSGNSMEPRIKNGDTVIVRRQNDVDDGDVAIVCINGTDATCKQIKRLQDERISLVSFNPAYQPMIYTRQEMETLPVMILGKVVELRAKL